MLTRYRMTLVADGGGLACDELSYYLYAALLEQAPEYFAKRTHNNGAGPLSQYLCRRQGGDLIWTVCLLGSDAEQALSPIFDGQTSFHVKKPNSTYAVAECSADRIADIDELFELAAFRKDEVELSFLTTASFKSRGHYLILPSSRLIIQSLIKKWNGVFPDCPIEDEDGQGMDALAGGLYCTRLSLSDSRFRLKGIAVPGFIGKLTFKIGLSGFHRELASALLLFSAYSGIGIKTALGMGGVSLG